MSLRCPIVVRVRGQIQHRDPKHYVKLEIINISSISNQFSGDIGLECSPNIILFNYIGKIKAEQLKADCILIILVV